VLRAGLARGVAGRASRALCLRGPAGDQAHLCARQGRGGRYDGGYDKTNLPDELILTSYFTVRDGKIVTLIVIRNTPASY
jgi:hypothetical protein